MNDTQKPKRNYRKITPATVARFKSERTLQGNGTKAVEILEPDIGSAKDRAYKLARKSEITSADDYVERRIEQIAVSAIDRVEGMVNSPDERIATKNAHFIIEQRRGKAVQKSETHNINLNIESVLQ